MKKAAAVLLVVLALAAAWLWWQRPRRVDMAAYVPADTLVYLETNSLPALVEALTATEAWRTAAAPAGLEADVGRVGWWGRVAAWTGLGPADKVALARAQIAVAVLGAQTGADEGALKLKPNYAVVIETHTGAARVRPVAEQRLNAFATRAYGQPRISQHTENDTAFIIWQAPDSTRYIVAAFVGSVVIVGPDEAAVRACLDVRRGARPSLEGNPGLADMRGRVAANDALAFGYIAPDGLGQILKLAATIYAAPLILSDPRIAGAVNEFVPKIAVQISGGLGWSTRLHNQQIEDRYFLTLKGDLAAKLREPLAAWNTPPASFAGSLPANTYSLTQYNFKSDTAAWLGLNKGLAGQLDVVSAVLTTRLLAAAWQPYGIDEPGRFLSVFDEKLATARIDAENGGSLVLHLRNGETYKDFTPQLQRQADWLNQWLGPAAAEETKGNHLWYLSGDKERGAQFGLSVIFGPAERVRQCVETQRTLDNNPAFQRAAQSLDANNPAQTVTFTDDQTSARAFLEAVAASNTQDKPQPVALTNALGQLPYAVSETRLQGNGFEKRTRSSFGLIGMIAGQFRQ